VASPLSVLTRYRDFRRLFLAELVMFGGDWFVMIPLLVLLPRLTGSGLYGALVLAADTGVLALLLPYAGTVADRLDRRKIMITSNLAGLAAVGLLLLVRSPATAWIAPLAVGALAVAKAFYSPAASAALPNLVEPADLTAANAVASSAWGTMTVVGASLGGVLAALFSPYTCFLVTAGAMVVATALVWGLRRPLQGERTAGGTAPAGRALVESLRWIGRHPRVAALVTVKSAVGMGNGVLVVFPLLALELGAGRLGTGLLFAARGLGALVGPLLLRGVLDRPARLLPGLALSMATYGLAYLGVSLAPWFPLVLLLIVVAHMAGGGNWAMSNAALQAVVPDRLRGRVFSADMMLATLAVSASQLVVGLFVDGVPWRVLAAACGATTLVYALVWRLVTARTVGAAGSAPVAGEREDRVGAPR
jgi:MFS family permease